MPFQLFGISRGFWKLVNPLPLLKDLRVLVGFPSNGLRVFVQIHGESIDFHKSQASEDTCGQPAKFLEFQVN